MREEIKGVIVAVGGGAEITTGDVEIVHQKIEMHLHFHIADTSPSIVSRIKSAVSAALDGLKEESNGEDFASMSVLPKGNKRDSMVRR